jgi:hypothetical protein
VGQTAVQLQPLVDALFWPNESSTLTKHGYRCSHRVRRSPTGFTSGPTALRHFRRSRPRFTTSTRVAPGHARNFLGPWSGKLVCDDFKATKPAFSKASLKSAAWPTLVVNSSICTRRTKANWPNRRCTQLASCTKSSGKHGK